ncbi:MAG: Wzz/FepE/Etk N-terminal domain-containing protein [Steroidobacteraceae bacterium]
MNARREGPTQAAADAEVLRKLDETELTTGEQMHAIWVRKWHVLAATVVGAAIATAAAFLVTPKYEASVLIMPVEQSNTGGGLGQLSGGGSELGGLAALAGLKIGGDAKEEALAVLQSELLTDMYISQNNLLPILLKHAKGTPTLWKANRFFKTRVREVTTDTKTGMVSMTITWTNPTLAAQWANGMVNMTNDYMRKQAIDEAERNIAYLNGEAAKTNVVEVREGIDSILLREINREMLARGSPDYALKVIDPAVPPEKPSSPQKAVWLVVGGLLGLLVSVGVVIIAADRKHAARLRRAGVPRQEQ